MTQPISLDSVKEKIAEILGVDPHAINVSNPDYAALLKEGVTVKPHIAYWRGQTRLIWEHIGLWFVDQEEKTKIENVMQLGKLNLLSPEDMKRLGSIETKLRMLPKKHGIETMFGAFIPVTFYEDFKQEADELTAQFLTVRDSICENWPIKLQEAELNIREAARWAWRYKKGDPQGLGDYSDENDFVEVLTGQALALIPSRDSFFASFSINMEMHYIPMPDLLASEMAQAEKIKAEASQARELMHAQKQLAFEQIEGERRAIQDRERQLTQMNRDMVSQAQANAQKVMDDFFTNLVSESRQLANEVYAEVIAGIKKNGTVHGRSVVALRNLITQVTKLATFYQGDRDIETILKPAREILAALPENRAARVEDYVEQMTEVRALAKAQLTELGVNLRGAREIGIARHEKVDLQKRGGRGLPSTTLELPALEIQKRGSRALSPSR